MAENRTQSRPLQVPRRSFAASHAAVAQLLALLDQIAEAGAGDAEIIHDARVAGRRLQAALVMLGPALLDGAAAAGEAVTQAVRDLGKLRDGDVFEELLAGVVSSHASAVAHLRKKAAKQQAKLGERAREAAQCALTAEMRCWLEYAFLPGERGNVSERRLMAMRARARATVSDLFACMGLVDRDSAPENLHACRLAAKRLRYTLELLERGDSADRALQECRALQDALGVVNDRHVAGNRLEQRARHVAKAAKARKRALAADMETLARHMHRVRDLRIARFFDDWPPERLRGLRVRAIAAIDGAF